MSSSRRLLQLLCAGVFLLVGENAILIVQFWQSNQTLHAIQQQMRLVQDELQHVREDTESNAEALELITNMLEEQQGLR